MYVLWCDESSAKKKKKQNRNVSSGMQTPIQKKTSRKKTTRKKQQAKYDIIENDMSKTRQRKKVKLVI